MQAIARWTNLSETTFVCGPDNPAADYCLRIFTPMSELPFAGHPAIGSAHAVLRHGRSPRTPARLVHEDPVCGSGNGCVAALIRRAAVLPVSSYRATQGRCMGRDGHVDVELAGDGVIWLGGQAVTCIEGTLRTG